MIWCDRLCVIGFISFMAFSAFQLLYMTLAVGKILVTHYIMNAYPEDQGNAVLAIERTSNVSNK